MANNVNPLLGFLTLENEINASGAINDGEVKHYDDDAGPDIPFTDEELSHWSNQWQHTLIVKTIGKENVSFQALENHLQCSWTRNGTIKVTDMEDGFISVEFIDEEDYNFVLFEGPWKVVDDCYLMLQRWRPLFSLTDEKWVVVWIRILKLPMELCNQSFLWRIGSTLGVMLKVDDRLSCSHKFARICVELNLRRRLASHIMIRRYRVNLEYEGICGERINEAREKMQGRIEECVEDFVAKEGGICLTEDLIGESAQGVKTKELELCHVMELKNDLVLKQKYLESRMKELELKEKQHEDRVKKHESRKREIEGQVMELVSDLLSQQKHFESRTKELELKEKQHEGQVKEHESKTREFEGQVKKLESIKKHFERRVVELANDLVSQQKHFEIRMKELELKEKQHEDQVKEHESKTREFEGQVKELEYKKKLFESQMMELVNDLASQQKHFDSRMEEVESKEKQHEGQVKELESIKKHIENQAKELASKYHQFVGQREKFISKVRGYESQMKVLVLKKKRFKIRMKEFESKEKVLESRKKHFESHAEVLKSIEMQFKEQVKELESKGKQLDDRMKEFESKEKVLESRKKHFESQAEELKSKETQLKEQVKELESKEKKLDDRVKEFESKKRDSQDRVMDLRPETDGHTLTVKVISSELVKTIYSNSGEVLSRTAECLVGDETGTIIFTARNEQVDLMKPGATVILDNAKIDMFKGCMRLVVDWRGDIEVTEPANFEVREDNNLSLDRYFGTSYMVQSLVIFSLKIAVVDAKIYISGHF
ncbi:hypothetical protein P8452_57784 [Trifolium repens]|nr:hypothetical protein P8452_57784 [Trifolium repens]